MLRRKVYDELFEWKARSGHKCLLVKGQRQVGKSFIIEHFGKDNYENVIKLDFIEDSSLSDIFAGKLDVDSIIRVMKLRFDPELFVPGSTLIILDEIQECPRARTALKYFTTDGRYDVIASGSLIDARQGDHASVPVGYEEHITMYSLDFEEFLWARKVPYDEIMDVRKHIRDRIPIDEPILRVFNSHFRDYMIIGGMPAAVNAFLINGDYADSWGETEAIIASCKSDMTKYNSGLDRLKVVECFDSIPSQLSQSNKKFMYSRVSGGESRGATREYMDSLLWIKRAGYGNYCYSLGAVESPLIAHSSRDQFKVYMSDTGMLIHIYGREAQRALYEGDTAYNFGAVTENMVAECLMKAGLDRYYYRKSGGDGRMEIDFILELGRDIVAVEVKSGSHRDAPSIAKVGKYHHVDRRVMFENGNISMDDDGMEHYPLFASAFIKDMVRTQPGPRF